MVARISTLTKRFLFFISMTTFIFLAPVHGYSQEQDGDNDKKNETKKEDKEVHLINKAHGTGSTKYIYRGHTHSYLSIRSVLRTNPKAAKKLRGEGFIRVTGWATAFTGGALMGYGFFSDPRNATAFISGAGVTTVAFIISAIANNKVKKAVSFFNEDVALNGEVKRKIKLDLAYTGNGAGLYLTF